MAEREWTTEQKQAITSRGGSLLLSAAAGSGKTAVLVERIIGLLTQKNNPVQPSELLVVTFTNAAAGEMKQRVTAGIDSLIEKNPSDSYLRSIKMRLPEAQISTMDSFCIKLVRENFHKADISPDFTLLDGGEEKITEAQAMEKTLDNLCKNFPDTYDMLNSMTSYGRDDEKLSEKIKRLHKFSLSHPFPSVWLDGVRDMYSFEGDIKNSVWGKIIAENALYAVDFALKLLEDGINDASYCEAVYDGYKTAFEEEQEKLKKLSEILRDKDWDTACKAIKSFCFPSLPRAPRGFGKDPAKTAAEGKYKKAKEIISTAAGYFCAGTEENREDLENLRPVIDSLIEAVKDYGKNLIEEKELKNSYGFSDIMHKALELLASCEDGEIKPTELAASLSGQYREILIDEYQDTNEAQDMLFSLISRNGENIFTVGDVKQSIYRFRLAMPEIFMKKNREYHDYDGENYPAKIILGKNFRSRKGILDNINFLFENLMSDYAGEMEYTEKEALYFGGGYPEDKEPAAELRFLQSAGGVKSEAEYTAGLIKEMLDSGVTVQDKNGERPARPGDFCILLRSTKGKTDIYEKALEEAGIGVSCEKKTSLFDTTEINMFMSLLKVINNPSDDISMLSVMFSPLYGFTPDEVSDIRLVNKNVNLYACLREYEEKSEKVKKLLNELDEYRKMSAVTELDIFIRTLLDISGCGAVVSALKNGENRRMNLIMLCTIAGNYMKNGGSGLGGFIRYIRRVTENNGEIAAASDMSENADVVRIYSIHKSKGLEFPFVLLCDCAKGFNDSDIKEDMIISPVTGVGMVVINNDKLQKYSTVCHSASKIAVKRAMLSEELRILYVAMTRAREKIIMISTVKDIGKEIEKTAVDAAAGRKPSPYAVLNAKSYMQWLLMGFMSHPDMKTLADIGGMMFKNYKKAESPLKVIVDEPGESEEKTFEAVEEDYDEETVRELRKIGDYVYPYIIPDDIRPKRIASDFESRDFEPLYFAKSRPSFLNDGKLSAAQAGTANHIFLQCCDFNMTSPEEELKRLVEKGVLTEIQAPYIRIEKIQKFLNSSLFKRIMNAESVYREKEFTVQVKLSEIYPDAVENVRDEKILVLGKADLIFTENGQAVVVDYKTDRGKSPEDFKKAYSGQLKIYKTAAEQVLEMPVKETIIYSLDLEKEIYTDI